MKNKEPITITDIHSKIIYESETATNIKEAVEEAVAKKIMLIDADLECVNLNGANLANADFSLANLRYANLSGANLIKADFTGADLQNAKLNDANLEGADFTSALLRGANLNNANLANADLKDADFKTFDLTDKL